MSGSVPSIDPELVRNSLPGALTLLVDRVVRATRLWPSEKQDVRAELESHFHEGLLELSEEGRSLEESVALLRDQFGDPQLAAKLIRRGKKRGRPMYRKILATCLALTIVVLGAGAGYLTYLSFGKPTPTVDYVARINEPIVAVPHEDRAWPILRDVTLEILPQIEAFQALQVPGNEELRPAHAKWPEAVGLVHAVRPFVPRIVEGLARPTFGYVYGNEGTEYLKQRSKRLGLDETAASLAPSSPEFMAPPTLSMLLPHLSDMRRLVRLLVLDAREHMTHDAFESAWQSLDAAHRLGMFFLEGRTLIEQLVGAAALRLSLQEMQHTLYQFSDRITPDQLRHVRASRLFDANQAAIRANLNTEHYMIEDVVQHVFTDDGTGSGRLIPGQFAQVSVLGAPSPQTVENGASTFGTDAYYIGIAAVHADRKETLRKYREILDQAIEYWSLPLYDTRRTEGDRLIRKLAEDPVESRRYALIVTLLPTLSRADLLVRETAMFRNATQMLAGMLQYRADHGAWPERLAELSPTYLPCVPTDIYSGLNLRYVVSDGAMKLYSLGRNLQDDGGSRVKLTDALRSGTQTEADIVFWPAE